MGSTKTPENKENNDFLRTIIREDLAQGKNGGRIHTRFPPEPNGYLHIGHAKSICLNFGIAEEFGGKCNLRFDDTNPSKEEAEYVESIKEDVRWLGFDWEDRLYFASSYFQQLHDWAVELIRQGKAYVDDQNANQIREMRGTPTEPGRNSPYRDRPIKENLELFAQMKKGEFGDGEKTLRAKIDMAHPNLNMRDPVMYRISHAAHHRTGTDWCIYPMYDWAHGLEDAIEGITHSLCTLEFENHRPLYDWFLDQLETQYRPRQYEFARLNLSYTVMSKRKLLELVQKNYVDGWDDPRMPTICGMRRRGYPAASLRRFAREVGISKTNSLIALDFLEHILREDLNKTAPRRMAVLDPVKVVITNYPEDQEETLQADNNPEDPNAGTRPVTFGREVYIERSDFMEDPPRKFFRMAPGREVRLKHAYCITCTDVIKDAQGTVTELRCTYDPETRGGATPDGRKVKGTLHWVSARHARPAELRLYDKLFTQEDMGTLSDGEDYKDFLNPESLTVNTQALLEPSLAEAAPGTAIQFLRQGYFCPDSRDFTPARPVFNRTVTMRDTWAKLQKKMQQQKS